jgi:IS605 OrfB family transposase
MVFAAIERGGNARAAIAASASAAALDPLMFRWFDCDSILCTDELAAYDWFGSKMRRHHRVLHSMQEFAKTEDGTRPRQHCRRFFGLLKRAIVGVWHQISEKHLHRYAAEYEFRWNHRQSDVARSNRALPDRSTRSSPLEGAHCMSTTVLQAAKGQLYGGQIKGPLAAVARIGGQRRYLWNLFLADNSQRHQTERKFIFYREMSARLPSLLKNDEHLRGLPHRVAQMTVRRLDVAIRTWIDGVRDGTIKDTAKEKAKREKRRRQRYAVACAKAEKAGKLQPAWPPEILDAKGFPKFKRRDDNNDGFSFVGHDCDFRSAKDRHGREKMTHIRLPESRTLKSGKKKKGICVRVRGLVLPAGILAAAEAKKKARKIRNADERQRALAAISLGDILVVSFMQEPTGWHVAIQFEGPVKRYAAPSQSVIGLDAGVKKRDANYRTIATLCSGRRIFSPQWVEKTENEINRLNRVLARRRKGSANRRRAAIRLARAHRRIRNRRMNFLHKTTTKLVRRHAGFAVEDLSLKGLVRTRLAKSFASAALGELLRMLHYKANWAGREWRVMPRFERSTGRCPFCDWIGPKLLLSERMWQCESCGVWHDRDVASATVIELHAVGQAVSEPAGGIRRKRGFAIRDGGRAKVRPSHGGSPRMLMRTHS